MTKIAVMSASLSIILAGCVSIGAQDAVIQAGVDGIACVGSVATAVDGLKESENSALLSLVRKPSGKGGVCSAKVFAVTSPVVLYRVFDSSKPYTKQGSWWSLERPGNSRSDYRAANAICPEWSGLDRVISCEVYPGTQVVLGTTQSAECSDGAEYPKTGVTQVFVPNNGRVGIVHVGNCGEEANWP